MATITILLIVVCGGIVHAEEPVKEPDVWNNPKNMSASIWLMTDYVFRGISNTDENPAIQGSLDYTYKGFYLGIWGSNTRFTDAAIEIDYYAGYAGSFGELGYDIMGIYYSYPSGGSNPEPDYFEAHLGLTYKFVDLLFGPTLGTGYNYSPDFFGEDGDAHYVHGTLDLSLPYGFSLGGEVGYQDVEGDETTGNGLGEDGGDGFNYYHWRISLAREIPDWFNLDLSYHDTGGGAEGLFGDIADQRVVFTISRTF